MTGISLYTIRYGQYYLPVFIAACLLCILQLITDRLHAMVFNTGYFFSESFLFSSFWWLFLPIWAIANQFNIRLKKKIPLPLLFLSMACLHLAGYPLLVWLLSAIWFDHSFPVWQTLGYEIANLLIPMLLIYSVIVSRHLFRQEVTNSNTPNTSESSSVLTPFVTSIIVTNARQQVVLPIQSIQYITVRSPYVCLATADKKYLHSATLKLLITQLDPDQFVRIHKSTIVNLQTVVSCKSRLNGDYDITLVDGTILRLSRNYAAQFKIAWQASHRDNMF